MGGLGEQSPHIWRDGQERGGDARSARPVGSDGAFFHSEAQAGDGTCLGPYPHFPTSHMEKPEAQRVKSSAPSHPARQLSAI